MGTGRRLGAPTFLAHICRSALSSIGQSGAVATLHPMHEFAEIVALLVGAADEDADLSMVKVVRDDDRRVVTFETRTPQAFVGPGRTRATALRDALAERLGDPRLQLQVSYPPPHDDEATP